MKLNKSTSYTLLHVLNGRCTSGAIASVMGDVDVRTVQRSLQRLFDMDLLYRSGPSNDLVYTVNYSKLLDLDIPEDLLIDEKRPDVGFNFGLLDYLEANSSEVTSLIDKLVNVDLPIREDVSAKDLEYLTIELSWKSSALEGNTYTLLDTELLLKEGIKAKNRTEFETQMILNHKEVISFILDNKELFTGGIKYSTVEQMHRIIGKNLGIDPGVRKKLVRISSSNYTPIANPHTVRETVERILAIIGTQADPVVRSLLAFSLVPYLQTFEDGNKRTGRMLANAILIAMTGMGFSLRRVEARDLALAYLAFYEFNSLKPLARILQNELKLAVA
jgi:hypothetical protein